MTLAAPYGSPAYARYHYLLAAVYARPSGLTAGGQGVSSEGIAWDVGYSQENISELRPLVSDLLKQGLLERGLDPSGKPALRVTGAGPSVIAAYSQDVGVDIVELVRRGRLRCLLSALEVAGGRSDTPVPLTKVLKEAAITSKDQSLVLGYLRNEGLLDIDVDKQTVVVTEKGATVTQGDPSILRKKDAAQAAQQINYISNSNQVSIAGHNAVQRQSWQESSGNYADLAERTRQLLGNISALDLPEEDLEEVNEQAHKLIRETEKTDLSESRIKLFYDHLKEWLRPALSGSSSGVAAEVVKHFLNWG